jgi:hypothetical protein
MRVIYPPQTIDLAPTEKAIFLAGSIENGVAEDWQSVFIQQLETTDWVVLNPRRQAWDATWEQSLQNPLFAAQVNWELEGLERASLIVIYFVPNTLSPISLLEFGLHARSEKLVVCCPQGFWRKGNIDVVCQRYGIGQVSNLEELISYALTFRNTNL